MTLPILLCVTESQEPLAGSTNSVPVCFRNVAKVALLVYWLKLAYVVHVVHKLLVKAKIGNTPFHSCLSS